MSGFTATPVIDATVAAGSFVEDVPLLSRSSYGILIAPSNDPPSMDIGPASNETDRIEFFEDRPGIVGVIISDDAETCGSGSDVFVVELSAVSATIAMPAEVRSLLSFELGTGLGDAAMRFRAPFSAARTALQHFEVTPTQDFHGPGLRLDVVIDDGGSCGGGAAPSEDAHSVSASFDFNVSAVNDGPVVILGPVGAYVEDSTVQVDVAITDVDAGEDESFRVDVAATGGTLRMDAGHCAGPSCWVVGTLAEVNGWLQTLKLEPPRDFHGPLFLNVSVRDGGGVIGGNPRTAHATQAVAISPMNDPPVFALPTATPACARHLSACVLATSYNVATRSLKERSEPLTRTPCRSGSRRPPARRMRGTRFPRALPTR